MRLPNHIAKLIVTAMLVTASSAANSVLSINVQQGLEFTNFSLPPSQMMSQGAIAAYQKSLERYSRLVMDEGVEELRKSFDENILIPTLSDLKARVKIVSTDKLIADVPVTIVEPYEGVPPVNSNRILIHLHGGGFILGNGGYAGRVGAAPIADSMKIRVVTVDYRLAPEHDLKQTLEDITRVYRTILNEYNAESIGIYGCSAGGKLSGISTAWFRHIGLPSPGAIGVLCSGLSEKYGDSNVFWTPTGLPKLGTPLEIESTRTSEPEFKTKYFKSIRSSHPQILNPASSQEVLSFFPPTLLVTGTRSTEMSQVIETHRQLVRAGVDSDLHIWDGMWHGFSGTGDLFPEAQEALAVIVEFFDRNLK